MKFGKRSRRVVVGALASAVFCLGATTAQAAPRPSADTAPQRAAHALGCDLVYVLVPRGSLDDTVRAQARRKAAQHLGRVEHHSRLEDQAVDYLGSVSQLDDLAARFVDRRGLWSEPPEAESPGSGPPGSGPAYGSPSTGE